MAYILIIGLIILIGVLIAILWLASFPKNFSIKKTKLIDAKIDLVFEHILELKKWALWSPWRLHEPLAAEIISENSNSVGSSIEWEGALIGNGMITTTKVTKNKYIEQGIEFFQPKTPPGKITFKFDKIGSKTKLTWGMLGAMPFFFRFLNKKVEKMIGFDYEIGLDNIEMLLNAKVPKYKIEFIGSSYFPEASYVYRSYATSYVKMNKMREKTVNDLVNRAKKLNPANFSVLPENPFTIINKLDIDRNSVNFSVCVPVKIINKTAKLPPGLKFAHEHRYRAYLTKFSGDLTKLPLALKIENAHSRMVKTTFGTPVEYYESLNPKDAKISIYRRISK